MALTERVLRINETELLDALRSPSAAEQLGAPDNHLVIVDAGGTTTSPDLAALPDQLASLPCVVVGVLEDPDRELASLFDVAVAADDPLLAAVLETVQQCPQASSALAMLLRGAEHRAIGDGFVAESAVYSALQAGPEFAAWCAANPQPKRSEEGSTVRVEREADTLTITLSRPAVHNAFSSRMRDELLDALAVAREDPSIDEVVLQGDGPSFCSGGDLTEFGTFPDPATAHLLRLTRSAGRALATLADRVTAHLHGACMGSGIELPAFAARVVARADARIGLPEVGMGLVPGAGGTVSLPRRIGRHRTALLALSQQPIDASTALDWGLVDEIAG